MPFPQKFNLLNPAQFAGRSILKTGGAIAGQISRLGNAATKPVIRLLELGTQKAGQTATFLGDLPMARRFANVLRLDWLVGISDRVDLEKAEAEVQQFRQRYPEESPNQIAHRIMVQKALQAGGIGLASSILPGFAAAFLAIDLAATTALQTEMVYQIAAAYGMNLRDSNRKGEVLAIFGLALGGRNAVKAGLAFLRNVPLAGAMIGAGTNATMLYSLGYAACRFYEAKLRSDTEQPAPEALEAIHQESEQYLTIAMAQQAIVDQILVHMVLASYPKKSWESILPDLKALKLEENSLTTIEQHLQSPRPLGALLQELNCDFAVPLVAQCRRIAEQDQNLSEAETEVLQAITEKCHQSAFEMAMS